ncbi:MAG: ribosome biogenesis GTP-binding protein YihA/YsxC [Defluviitaleaceae bacterium]|nr:ribosome biogenesis GTP-binding protein YihA/YsxC [Defluviitaleaceae bacterium]MCL2240763.1 ribosome biogenesis GTP-binding protein YihA/YsxC [Defluviitaleaceae bacterium]
MSIIINRADIAATAVAPAQFPTTRWPEVAFAGRSNVGKSSLINAMLGRRKLARTSRQPGKTRTINFFSVEDRLYFVDLPGYGYARVSKAEQETWGAMVEGYLKDRAPLKRIFLLMDIRHEPSAGDRMIYEWCLYYQLPFTVVATKSDKLSRNQVAKHLGILRRALDMEDAPIPFSSETRQGRDALWALIVDNCGLGVI